MKTHTRARLTAAVLSIVSAAIGGAVTALAGCTGSGQSDGSIQLPMGSGHWSVWWCDECSKVAVTEGEKPTPDAQIIGTIRRPEPESSGHGEEQQGDAGGR